MKSHSKLFILICSAIFALTMVFPVMAKGKTSNTQQEDITDFIRNLEKSDEVTFVGQDRSPYNPSVKLERYRSGEHYYLVNVDVNQITEIVPVDDMKLQYSTDAVYTKDELEKKAREFINIASNGISLDNLTPKFGDKGGETFFFRWEDTSSKVGERTVSAFIQVGFSCDGTFLNYVNTISLAQTTVDSQAPLAFSEFYANGGSYWTLVQGSMSTQSNAGYCYIAGWCSPKNFYYANVNNPATVKGRWSPNSNTNTKASAFIPGTHATTVQACYSINSGTSKCINQNIWFNTWVSITDSAVSKGISKIELSNGVDGSSKTPEVAWDETWVYTP